MTSQLRIAYSGSCGQRSCISAVRNCNCSLTCTTLARVHVSFTALHTRPSHARRRCVRRRRRHRRSLFRFTAPLRPVTLPSASNSLTVLQTSKSAAGNHSPSVLPCQSPGLQLRMLHARACDVVFASHFVFIITPLVLSRALSLKILTKALFKLFICLINVELEKIEMN